MRLRFGKFLEDLPSGFGTESMGFDGQCSDLRVEDGSDRWDPHVSGLGEGELGVGRFHGRGAAAVLEQERRRQVGWQAFARRRAVLEPRCDPHGREGKEEREGWAAGELGRGRGKIGRRRPGWGFGVYLFLS